MYTYIDTGSSALHISTFYFDNLLKQIELFTGIPLIRVDDGVVFGQCNADYPNLWFMFDLKWLEVLPKDYVLPDTGAFCLINIQPIDMPFNVLGMPLLSGYYTTFDPERGTISVAPNQGSTKARVIRSSGTPYKTLKSISTNSIPDSDDLEIPNPAPAPTPLPTPTPTDPEPEPEPTTEPTTDPTTDTTTDPDPEPTTDTTPETTTDTTTDPTPETTTDPDPEPQPEP